MKINVAVKTNSKMERVEKQSGGSYVVRVGVAPIEGKANKRVIELLAEFLGVPKSKIQLVSGAKSKNKVFEVFD